MGWMIAAGLAVSTVLVAARLARLRQRHQSLKDGLDACTTGPWRREDPDFPGCRW